MKRSLPFLVLLFLIEASCRGAQKDNQEIRRTDFRNFDYKTCFNDKSETTRVTNGMFSRKSEDGDFGGTVRFEVLDVVYGDLDADGQEEAVVNTLCNGGGTGQFTDGWIYQMINGRPIQIGAVGEGDRAIGGIHEVRIRNGELEVDRYGGNSGACCPEYVETFTYKLHGKELIEAGKSGQHDFVTKDGNYAVRRVHFPRGTSSTVLTGATGEMTSYLIGARAGQTMTLQVTGANLKISLEAPEGADIAQPQLGKSWTVRLPASGDYRLIIGAENGKADFRIELGIF